MRNSRLSPVTQRLIAVALLLVPSLASAHPGQPGHAHGLLNGLAHPITGLDHICAMIAVGLWAAQRGGRALWLVPLTFVTVMSLGSVLGMQGIVIPYAEQGIVASVMILGLLIAAAAKLPVAASALLVAFFAVFHGYAHGAEMPATASGLTYGAGFVASTALLHLCGIGAGMAAIKFGNDRLVRLTGGAISACGLYLCFA